MDLYLKTTKNIIYMEKSKMDLEKLQKKLLLAQARLEEELKVSQKAIDSDEFDAAKKSLDAIKEYESNIAVIKEQIAAVENAEKSLYSGNEKKQEPNRLLFNTDEINSGKNKPESEEGFEKRVHVLKYGTPDKAVEIVTREVHGTDYYVDKYNQMKAFAKFVRYGNRELDRNEAKSLRTLILAQETISDEIKAGASVQEINAVKATLQESALDLGGELVPEDLRLEVIKRMMGMTAIRGRARQITTTRDKVEYPRLEGGNAQYTSAVRVTWTDELPASGEHRTNFTLGNVNIPVHTCMASTDVSNNLLEDSGVNVIGLVKELFAEAMAIDEDGRFLTGVGGNTPRGILGNRSGAELTPDDGITYVASGDASLLTADGIIDLSYEPDVQYLQNAIFVGAKATFKTARKLQDGNGDYLWARGIEKAAPPILVGYDYIMNEHMPAIAANAYPLIFGDPRGYLIVDRVGMTVKRVEDRNSAMQNFISLIMRRRLGGQVVEPWRFKALKIATS